MSQRLPFRIAITQGLVAALLFAAPAAGWAETKPAALPGSPAAEVARLNDELTLMKVRLVNTEQHLEASLNENARLQKEVSDLKQRIPVSTEGGEVLTPQTQQRMAEMQAELERLRKENTDAEKRYEMLKQVLTQKDAKIETLQAQANISTDFIRMYDPLMKDGGRLENMQKALFQLAKRLKDTETALEEQTARTQSLAKELAEAKNDPAIAKDPSLVVKPGEKAAGQAVPLDPNPVPDALIYKKAPVDTKPGAKPATLEAPPFLKSYQAYMAQKDYARAEQLLTVQIGADPSLPEPYKELSRLYLIRNKPLEAQALLDTYKRLNPRDTEIAALQAQINAKLQAKPSSTPKPR